MLLSLMEPSLLEVSLEKDQPTSLILLLMVSRRSPNRARQGRGWAMSRTECHDGEHRCLGAQRPVWGSLIPSWPYVTSWL